jgi:CRP-like cAMP-binding protein
MSAALQSKRAFEAVAEQLQRFTLVASLRGGATSLERVAAFLLMRVPPQTTAPHTVAMPLTRRDLADHLMTTVETIARNMAAMRRAGVIGKERGGEVEIRDLQALEALASGAATLGEAYARAP